MKHNVQVDLTISSYSDADMGIRRAAHEQGLPTPDGPMVSRKVVTFASWGATLPDAAMPAMEAAADFIQGTGVGVVPKAGGGPREIEH